jgi:predicted dehydrogenase
VEEGIGPVAGDEISAQFYFEKGVVGSFTSRARMREQVGHWGIELVGSKGSARVLSDIWPRVFYSAPGKWEDVGKEQAWRPAEGDPSGKVPAGMRDVTRANARLVDDWLEAIEKDREPMCSGRNGAKAVEMVMGVYWAALGRKRVELPLAERGHPLA